MTVNSIAQTTCSYQDPDGNKCPEPAGESGLCLWHDPVIKKLGASHAKRLEELVRSGRSLAGFQLNGAKLDGINLNVEDQSRGADLRGANLSRASLRGAHLFRVDLFESNLLKADFTDANLNGANLEHANLLGAEFANSRIDGVRWGAELIQHHDGQIMLRAGATAEAYIKFQEAEEIYRTLSISSAARGYRRAAGEFYYREMQMHHHNLPHFSVQRIVSSFAYFLYGYGERPAYIIANALVYLVGIAGIYFLLGLTENGHAIAFDANASWLENLFAYGNCLYFSVITYTTVGFGDIAPTAAAKPIAALEAMSGNFMMALFVVVFVRKLAR